MLYVEGATVDMLRALDRAGLVEGALTISYRRRYEAQNCFVTPALLREYARLQYADMDLFGGHPSRSTAPRHKPR